jgi:hypothetical protein
MRMERRFSGGAGGWNWIQSKESVPSFNDLTSNNLPKVPYLSITNSLEWSIIGRCSILIDAFQLNIVTLASI